MSTIDPLFAPPSTPSSARPARPGRRWLRRVGIVLFVVSCLAVGIAAPLPYLLASLETLAESGRGLSAHYVDQPVAVQAGLYVHASAGGLAMLLTPIQFSGRIRRRLPALHRWSGRASVATIVVAAAGGLAIAPFGYAGLGGFIGFSTLALIWGYGALRLLSDARRGRMASHRRWGVRVLSLTYAAVTLRLWVGLWVGYAAGVRGVEPDVAFDQMYVLTPFLSWIPNLLVAEWYLRRRRDGSGVPLPSARPSPAS